MIAAVQEAVTAHGISDEITAVGQFNPRGHTGAMFAGGLAGGEAGGLVGNVAGDVGVITGSLGAMHATDAASGLPPMMLVGVSERFVYGFAARNRHDEPTDLVFTVARADLTVKVHRRVNVRVLELIDAASGSCIELEGNRVPVTHSKDVIEALKGR